MTTSRERVLSALNHTKPDRVPVDFSGHRSSGIAGIAYANLREYLGLPPKPVRLYDVIQQLAIVDEDVLDYFGVDTVELGRAFALDDASWADWVLPDGTPCQVPAWSVPERDNGAWVLRSKSGNIIGRMPEGALYFEQTGYPFAEGGDLDKIPEIFAESMWTAVAAPPGPVSSQDLADGAKRLRASTQRAIIGLFGGNLLEIGQFLYRNDNFLMMMASEPAETHRFLDRLVEAHLARLEGFLAAVGDSIDIILFGDDLGMQSGPQVSPAMYEEFFKPRHKAMWDRAKELADVKVMLHCCGGVLELLPHLTDAGLDAINPVQISAQGMDAPLLKERFGSEITFWGGGCDTQTILPNGSPREVADHVTEQVKTLQRGGGFVFQQVHNVLANVPPQNVEAMFQAVHSPDLPGSRSSSA